MTVREITQFDGERLAAEYRASRERMITLIASTDDTQRRLVVAACPAWTVHDLVSHVTGIAVDLSVCQAPTGDPQSWVDRQVDERRGRATGDVVAEWVGACEAFEPMIAGSPKAFWGLVYDLIVHEFDLRQALGDRSGRDGDAVMVAAELGLRLVKGDLRSAGLGSLLVEMAGEHIRVGSGDVELTLRTTPFECLRLLGSRRTRAELEAADFEGDLDRYLDALVHMELPVQSLGE
jgi:uncharacterized protein (TIGR03083 family)